LSAINLVYKLRARSGGNVRPPVPPATLTNFSPPSDNAVSITFGTLGRKCKVLDYSILILTVSMKRMFCADSWIKRFVDYFTTPFNHIHV